MSNKLKCEAEYSSTTDLAESVHLSVRSMTGSPKLYAVKLKGYSEGSMIISDKIVETIGDCLSSCLTISSETVSLWWSGQVGVNTKVFESIPISE